MADKRIVHVLIDTSSLRDAGDGFGHPNFRKLLEYSKTGSLKIYVPHIVWEERRTQLLSDALEKTSKLRTAYEKVKNSNNIIFTAISEPVLSLLEDSEIVQASKETMKTFADENGIELLPLEHDHAARAWHRYFEILPPFSSNDTNRENRRKDIPDSWIFESAIDIKARHPDLIVIVKDGKLTAALKDIEINVQVSFEAVLEIIESADVGSEVVDIAMAQELKLEGSPPTVVVEGSPPTVVVDLKSMLAESQKQFELIETKVLGFIFFLDPSPKDQLLELLGRTGIPVEILKNAIDRLVIANFIGDTGSNYILKNREAGEIASKSVEAEIISLMSE